MNMKSLRNRLALKTRAWVVGLILSAFVVTGSTLLVISQRPVLIHANESMGNGNMSASLTIDPDVVSGFDSMTNEPDVIVNVTWSCLLPQGYYPFFLKMSLTVDQQIGFDDVSYSGNWQNPSPAETVCDGTSYQAQVIVDETGELFDGDTAHVTSVTFPYVECKMTTSTPGTAPDSTCYDQTSDVIPFSDSIVTIHTLTINPLANLQFQEGSTQKVTDFFTDNADGADSWTVTVDFGDGTSKTFKEVQSPTTGGPLTGLYFTLRYRYGDDDTYIVTVTVTDNVDLKATTTATLTVTDAPITITRATGPSKPAAVGTMVTASGKFADPGFDDTDTAQWQWGDGTVSNVSLSSNKTGNHSIPKSAHIYSAANLYPLILTVFNDDDPPQTAQVSAGYAVIYSPTSSARGSGTIVSPAGAYMADRTLTGSAAFSLSCSYKGGKTTPNCTSQLQFQPASFTFMGTSGAWMVVTGHEALIQGTGTVNGTTGYSYLLTLTDTQFPAGGGVAQYRLKVWNTATGDVVYDTQPLAGITVRPQTPLASGSMTLKD